MSARRASVRERDETELAEMGYKQELKRDWGLLHNFGVSFSIISVITGITTLFGYGLATGGPAVMSIGWIVVCFFTMFVALAMAEVVSSVPSSGGPYFWAYVLAPKKHAAFFSWATGWFNLLGQVAVTTGISFGLANLISFTISVQNPDWTNVTYLQNAGRTVGIYAAILISHGVINTFGVSVLRYLNNTSILLHSLGIFSLIVAMLVKAPTHQPASFVFGTFNDGTGVDGADGWSIRASSAYVAVTGILLAQYTITGFDASAHLAEETHKASWSAPLGVIMSVGVSAVFGFFVILGYLFCIQDFDRTISSDYGQPILQILVDIFGPSGAIALMTLIMICVYFCGLFSMTANSRMLFAFARDRGISPWFAHVDQKFKSPIRTVWLAAFLSFCLALPSLGSTVAFSAATSIATIGLYISYILPITTGAVWPENFRKGPFHLGVFSRPIALVATLWVAFITIVFCLPTANPVTQDTVNYTAAAVGIIAVWIVVSWFAFARRTFSGPVKQIEAAELGLDLNDPEQYAEVEKKGKLNL